MIDFAQLIEEETGSYQGPFAHLIRQAGALYDFLTHLLGDPSLPGKLRPLVMAGIAYFILPVDIVPEDLRGPHGLSDDIFLAAFVADQVRSQVGSDEILAANWEGEGSILSLIEEILANEQGLIGDQRELLLWYIAYEYIAP